MPSPHKPPRFILILKRNRPSDPDASRIVPERLSITRHSFPLHPRWLICIRVIIIFIAAVLAAATTGINLLNRVSAVQQRPRHPPMAPIARNKLLHLLQHRHEALDPEKNRTAGFVDGLRDFRVAVVAEQAS